jgi:hypothetical protein
LIEDASDSNSLVSVGYGNVPLESGGGSEIAVVKLHADGDPDWAQTYSMGLYNEAYGICNSSDGYVIAGYSKESDFDYGSIWIFKIQKNGNATPVWSRVYDYGDLSIARSISPMADGGFIVGGYLLSSDSDYDMLALKLNASGEKEWERIFNGQANREDRAFSIRQTRDGGFILAGYTETAGNKDDMWLMKLNETGNITQ